ncbi:hypothetical protein PSACC_00310 [Paramicrosporidium saccamoebae]|uniref:Uncharacterized protein n=1 Tax=Paramicrosporidium saccamoebae TaxID=1246581 RepID=A0A2H9TQ48_9FUNG|nr:hypothetical protein PSACC_00310 [Paramicrosporidium saccamoebae]
MVKAGRAPIIPTLRRAKAKVESRYPNAFDNSIPLSKRIEAMLPFDDELAELFQLIHVFLATGYGDWRKFQEKNIPLYNIHDGFVMIYDGKIAECKALINRKLLPPSKPVSWTGLTFSKMRSMNKLIPDHLLTSGSLARVFFQVANLQPEGCPEFCQTYYCLSVYEKLTRDRMVPSEKLDRGLQHAWKLFATQSLYFTLYNKLVTKTPEEFLSGAGTPITNGQLYTSLYVIADATRVWPIRDKDPRSTNQHISSMGDNRSHPIINGLKIRWAQVSDAFNGNVPLPARIDAIARCGIQDWLSPAETLDKGFLPMLANRLDEHKAFITEKLHPIIVEPPHLPQLAFLEMRAMNGHIPRHLLVTGSRAKIFCRISNLMPEDHSELCESYYCLSVYEKFIRGMVSTEELEQRLEQRTAMWNSRGVC